MVGTIKTNRRYPLGDYKYITLEDVAGVPQKLMFNYDFVNKVRTIQLIGFEIVYAKYIKLKAHLLRIKDMDEVIKYLEEMKDKELKELFEIINGVSLEEETPQEDIPTIEE